MFAIILTSLRDMKRRWLLFFFMAILFSITFASYVSLITYKASVSSMYPTEDTKWLVVDKGFGGGEYHGSRLSPEVGEMLKSHGYDPIPEINQAVGTSTSNAILIKGILPEHLYDINPFRLVSGRTLQEGDDPRDTMIGAILANRLGLDVGDKISLRGRDFSIIGIFENGSYLDSQAWISLSAAQDLLGYGSDVSIYYIPDGGVFEAGTSPEKGVIIFAQGETGKSYNSPMQVFNYLGLVAIFLIFATFITLTNTLWRLAWLHRRQFGIIRALGYGKRAVVVYLLTQASVILAIGITLGGYFAITVVLSQITKVTYYGISIAPTWDLNTTAAILLLTLLFAGIGVLLLARRINQMKIPELLGKS